ncbi:histidine--tRNA ligase [Patescibacteria group bacterium]|nr:histidine--tRNA ligase [Patescibacteria group bacterium]
MPRMKKKIEEGNRQIRPKGAKRFVRLRGMKDVLPEEYQYWNLIIKKAVELAKVYSFKRTDTPVLENLELYERSTGKTSDIVTKEMFAFIDKNGERVALRPEATPGLVRSYVEHGMFNLPQPVKLFWIGPLFRHEKPQSGRLRQHTQFDLEIFGDPSPVADAQLILIAYNFFRELQIETEVQINSIGCGECRKEYTAKLTEYYKERGKRAKLCGDCNKRLVKNPLRLLDCKEEKCIELALEAPQIVDSLCDSCRNHFIKVLEYLDDLDMPYNLNPYLVRGLDYYTRTVFEIWPVSPDPLRQSFSEASEARFQPASLSLGGPASPELQPASPELQRGERGETASASAGAGGRQISLGGGGRYDNLIEKMGGRPTPACGFGLGIERAVMKIKENNIPIKRDGEPDVFLAQLGDQARRKAIILFEELRRAGFRVREAFTKDSLKSQLEIANQLNVKYTLILGQKEIMDGTILIRDMESGIQEIIDYKKTKSEIEKRLEVHCG